MNTFILMAEVISEPELRYTPDNKDAVASFLVQYSSSRPEEAPYRLKVTGWNNLANEIKEKYHKGDLLIVEGRLNMSTVERNGYKEKRTELTAQRIHAVGNNSEFSSSVSVPAANTSNAYSPDSAGTSAYKPASVPSANVPVAAAPSLGNTDQYDDIPF